MNIYFSDEYERLNDEIIGLMHRAAEKALRNEFGDVFNGADTDKLPLELSVSVVNYDEIQELNREYRGINKVTDVLSFPQFADIDELRCEIEGICSDEGSEDDVPASLLGDVVICYDRAIEQAEEYGTGITRELLYLFVHSIFHLFGYDHEIEDEKKVMRQREEAVLGAIGVAG